MADYRETVDYILGIPLFAQKIGKENLSSLLCRLGNPEKAVPAIHVAGRAAHAALWRRCLQPGDTEWDCSYHPISCP